MPRLARIYRHPVKALGVEPLPAAELTAGAALPGDRAFAVAHEAARLSDGWSACHNFIRGARTPALMAITARTHEDGRLTLSHPERPDITLDPRAEGDALVEWVRPLTDPARAAPVRLVRAGAAMTDSDYPSVSLLGLASLRALEGRAGRPLDPRRFRGNLWIDGAAPWEEFDWVGRRVTVGAAELEVRERIGRCRATHADPGTGRIDTDILSVLEAGWGHTDFGVCAVVTRGGRVAEGDAVHAP